MLHGSELSLLTLEGAFPAYQSMPPGRGARTTTGPPRSVISMGVRASSCVGQCAS
jgi:hypothetical protein